MRQADGCLLGLDLGTTTVRAVLFDGTGATLAEACSEPPVYYVPPDGAEIDAEERWGCAAAAMRACLANAGDAAGRIAAVGLSGLLHALVPVDAQGRALARAMLWMDQRCHPQAEHMTRAHGETIRRLFGHAEVSTTWSAPKLAWLVERRPDLVARTARFLSLKDLVVERLTGAVATDPGCAGGTLLYDRRAGAWSEEMLALVGVDAGTMPPILPPTTVMGGVTPAAAERTGLRAGTPVVLGSGDTTCTRLGAGTEGTGRGCLYLGTAAWLAVPRPGGGAFGATATTGAALKWLAELLGLAPGESCRAAYERLSRDAATAAAGAGGLLFLPHLMGERGPIPDPLAKGVLFGLNLAHGRAEVARAVLEGCALHLRSILEGVGGAPVDELVIAGGGARSPVWRAVMADVLAVRLLVPEVLEAGALGAALLAGVAVGMFESPADAQVRCVRYVGVERPDAGRVALYDRIYRLYLELEERVAPLYGRLPVEPLPRS